MPNLYVIAGCNGGLSPLQPDKVAFEAGRIMLDRIRKLMDENVDFAFETTLSTKSYHSLLKSAKSKGYISMALILLVTKS